MNAEKPQTTEKPEGPKAAKRRPLTAKEMPDNKRRTIVVEGPIGVGKSTLAEMLAVKLDARLIKEQIEENPFLEDFYLNMEKHAFQAQVSFLLSRWRQQQELREPDLFHPATVCDYLFAKNRIFAEVVLTPHELALYDQIYEHVVGEVIEPDLVVYLYASVDRLIRRVNRRAKPYEATITPEYLEQVLAAYNGFFFNYQDTPLLMVNTEQIDFVNRPDDFVLLFEKIQSIQGGRHHFSPTGHLPLIGKPAEKQEPEATE